MKSINVIANDSVKLKFGRKIVVAIAYKGKNEWMTDVDVIDWERQWVDKVKWVSW